MAKRLKEKKVLITHMLSSTAKRTMATAKRFAEILNFPENQIQKNAELYHASAEKMLDVLQQVHNHYPTVMLFGHNPGLTELANRLSDWRIENIPTTGMVAFKFTIDDWKKLDWKNGELLFYDYPKSRVD
jgi:phosphohistidine phosphatase